MYMPGRQGLSMTCWIRQLTRYGSWCGNPYHSMQGFPFRKEFLEYIILALQVPESSAASRDKDISPIGSKGDTLRPFVGPEAAMLVAPCFDSIVHGFGKRAPSGSILVPGKVGACRSQHQLEAGKVPRDAFARNRH